MILFEIYSEGLLFVVYFYIKNCSI